MLDRIYVWRVKASGCWAIRRTNVSHYEKLIIYRRARTLITHWTSCSVDSLHTFVIKLHSTFDSFRWPSRRYFSQVATIHCNDSRYITHSMENGQFERDGRTMKTIPVNWKIWFTIVQLVIRITVVLDNSRWRFSRNSMPEISHWSWMK